MTVQVDTTQLKQKSNEIKILRNELQNCMNQIEMLVLSMDGGWQGDAEKAYASRILYLKKEFSVILTFFDDYASLLNSFAVQYEEHDRSLSAKIQLA